MVSDSVVFWDFVYGSVCLCICVSCISQLDSGLFALLCFVSVAYFVMREKEKVQMWVGTEDGRWGRSGMTWGRGTVIRI